MATQAIAGVRFSDEFVANERPQNWREGILLLEPNGRAPLFGLMGGTRTRSTDDPQFNWWEKEVPSQRVQLTTNVGGGTTFTAATDAWKNAGVKINSILRLEGTTKQELALVTALPSATTVTVQRDYGAATPSAEVYNPTSAAINPYVHVVGTAHEENSAAPGGISYDPTRRFNFTQIFRDNFGASRTAQKTRLRTAPAVREAKRETLEQHSANIEKALFFGRGREYLTTTGINNEITRTTTGVYHYLLDNPGFDDVAGSNVITAPASVSFATIESWLEQFFRFGSSQKMAFLGNRAMLTIQQAIRKGDGVSYNLEQGQTSFGMNVTRLISPFGELMLKTHPLFNQLTSDTGGNWLGTDSWMFILDMAELIWRPLVDSDTKFMPNQQQNGLDGMLAGYITEGGLEIHHSKSHGVVKGIGAATAG